MVRSLSACGRGTRRVVLFVSCSLISLVNTLLPAQAVETRSNDRCGDDESLSSGESVKCELESKV